MYRYNFIYGAVGRVSQILSPDKAEIQFNMYDTTENALLKKDKFYHNGKRIPETDRIDKYLKSGSGVKFVCHVFDHNEGCKYGWFVVMCWLNAESSDDSIEISTGVTNNVGVVTEIKKRHGKLLMSSNVETQDSVFFQASKFYVYGKRFSASKSLSSELSVDDKVFFDAVPCFAEENIGNCNWFATCVFKGEKPELLQPKEPAMKNIKENKNDSTVDTPFESSPERLPGSTGEQNQGTENKFRNIFETIKLHTSNPRTVFVTGKGTILDVFNDEYGIILGCFKRNTFKTVLFHRKNAFLFKMCLANSKLSEIFIEGDHVKFIAVGAPSDFVTDWIALQVAVDYPKHLLSE